MLRKSKELPVALTIAGSDSGGGAGIQADLKTFASLDVHGTSAITCLTAQNPDGVRGIQPAKPDMVRLQIEAVAEAFAPRAIKTGMLYSRAIIETVAGALKSTEAPLVVDPVMVATSGAVLLKRAAIRTLEGLLLPRAALITPNLDEAALLTDMTLRDEEDLRDAARKLFNRFGCATLVKGGHLKNRREAADIFYDGKTELLLTAPFIRGISTHGTGCTYSTAITAFLARGLPLAAAVENAKQFISTAIASSRRASGHWILTP